MQEEKRKKEWDSQTVTLIKVYAAYLNRISIVYAKN